VKGVKKATAYNMYDKQLSSSVYFMIHIYLYNTSKVQFYLYESKWQYKVNAKPIKLRGTPKV
jgi:hypothetical protein